MTFSKNKMFLFGLLTCFIQVQAQDNGEVSNQIRIRIESLRDPIKMSIQDELVYCKEAVPQFYNSRVFEPVWDLWLAKELIATIQDSYNEGLNPGDYHLNTIKRMAENQNLTNYELADFDVLLTDAFLLLSSHLISGKVNPQLMDSEWKAIKREQDPIMLLNQSLITRDIRGNLLGIEPNFKAYKRLKERLMAYRKIANDGGWETISSGETIKLDMRDSRVPLVRKRLRVTGDLEPYTFDDEELYDQNVSDAIGRFQKRHGLTVDGNIGKETLAALNVSVDERIATIVLNMERCRWLPQNLGEKYIMVNLPGYELEVVNKDVVEMEMIVVCGKPFRQTPVFSAKMTYLVFNPYWTVPPTILAQDMIPAQAKNAKYLTNLNIKVLASDGTEVDPNTIDWQNADARKFPYTLRQDPGPNNALGVVKFIFPNSYNVYMHDTNHRELFVKTDRALSSGCIRLSRPMDLAANLLAIDPQWTQTRINEVIKSQQNYSVILKQPVQVHMQYWTAFVDENGVLNFRKDIYSRDENLLKNLMESAPQS